MDDFISREDTIEKMEEVDWYHQNKNGEMVHGANPAEHQAWYKAEDVYKVLEDMPPAQPEREKGKWIWKTGDVYKCSECETETHVDECFEEPIYNYCPYCNAFMDGYER